MESLLSRVRNAIWWRVTRAVTMPRGVDVCFVTHHKTGTVLAKRMADIVGLAQGIAVLNPERNLEHAESLRGPSNGGNRIAVYSHGWVTEADLRRFHRVYHFVRDPASLAISSALYHKKGPEHWLHQPASALSGELDRPTSLFRSRHATEDPEFIAEMLQGKTYFERISEMDMSEAVAFELQMCAGWNIRDMQAFPAPPNAIEVDIHEEGFEFMPFWQSVMGELEGNPLAFRLIMGQVSKWDRSNASNWSRHAKSHLSGVSDYAQFWTPEHQAMLEELGLARK